MLQSFARQSLFSGILSTSAVEAVSPSLATGIRFFAKKAAPPAPVPVAKKNVQRNAEFSPMTHKERMYARNMKRQALVSQRSTPQLELVFGQWTYACVVINKPAGLPVLSSKEGSDSVLQRLRNSGFTDCYFPHLLDVDTQGLQVISFNRITNKALHRSFSEGSFKTRFQVVATIPSCVVAAHKKGELPSFAAEFGGCVSRQAHLVGKLLETKPVSQARLEKAATKSAVDISLSNIAGSGFSSSKEILDCLVAAESSTGHAVILNGSGVLSSQMAPRMLRTKLQSSPSSSSPSQNQCSDKCPCKQIHSIESSVYDRAPSHPIFSDNRLVESIPSSAVSSPSSSSESKPDYDISPFECKSKYTLLRVDWERGLAVYDVEAEGNSPRVSSAVKAQFAEAGFPVVNDPIYNMKHIYEIQSVEPRFRAGYAQKLVEQKIQLARQQAAAAPAASIAEAASSSKVSEAESTLTEGADAAQNLAGVTPEQAKAIQEAHGSAVSSGSMGQKLLPGIHAYYIRFPRPFSDPSDVPAIEARILPPQSWKENFSS